MGETGPPDRLTEGSSALSLAELERLLLQRRRLEAVAGLRRIAVPRIEESPLGEHRAPALAGLARPQGIPLRRIRPAPPRPAGDLAAEPFPRAEEPWLRRPTAHLHPLPPRRRRRPAPRALTALKKGLASVIDGLIVLALILFVIALGFTLYDTYVGRLLHRSGPSVVRAQGATWAWQGRLAPPMEELTSAPLPFVPYSTTVTLQPRDIPPPTPAPGLENPTRLLIPRIQLDTPVVEVTIENGVWQVAEYAAGYHRGSARPGTLGNTVISGHKGLYGAVFLRLDELMPGDEIFLYAGPRLFRYLVVEKKSVWPHQVEVMAQTPVPTLTLITCTAYDTQRLVVVARLDREMPGGTATAP